jgi:uncharacterized cupredoxin-like copper-binding protein
MTTKQHQRWIWFRVRGLSSWWAVVGLLAGIALLTACGGHSASVSHANSLTIHATDFSFSKGVPQTVPAGQVHLALVNDSKTYLHEIWLYPQQQPQLPALLAAKRAGQTVDETQYLQGLAGKVEDLKPGKMGAFDAQLSPGTYEIACLQTVSIGGQTMVHYDMGMRATFTVQ